MKALVLNEVNQPLVLQETPSPKADKDQVIVQLKAAALPLVGLTVYFQTRQAPKLSDRRR